MTKLSDIHDMLRVKEMPLVKAPMYIHAYTWVVGKCRSEGSYVYMPIPGW